MYFVFSKIPLELLVQNKNERRLQVARKVRLGSQKIALRYLTVQINNFFYHHHLMLTNKFERFKSVKNHQFYE